MSERTRTYRPPHRVSRPAAASEPPEVAPGETWCPNCRQPVRPKITPPKLAYQASLGLGAVVFAASWGRPDYLSLMVILLVACGLLSALLTAWKPVRSCPRCKNLPGGSLL
jgi:hypothetical protein